MADQYEIMSISKHDRCTSQTIQELTGAGCRCKYDTVETKIVGTNNYRSWKFPKGRFPFEIGQIMSEEDLICARTTRALDVAAEKEKAKYKTEPQKGA